MYDYTGYQYNNVLLVTDEQSNTPDQQIILTLC